MSGFLFHKQVTKNVQPFLNTYFIWHAASNNGINLFKIIVVNNRNYNLKGIIDNYVFCHNRAALINSIYLTNNVKVTLIIRTARSENDMNMTVSEWIKRSIV